LLIRKYFLSKKRIKFQKNLRVALKSFFYNFKRYFSQTQYVISVSHTEAYTPRNIVTSGANLTKLFSLLTHNFLCFFSYKLGHFIVNAFFFILQTLELKSENWKTKFSIGLTTKNISI